MDFVYPNHLCDWLSYRYQNANDINQAMSNMIDKLYLSDARDKGNIEYIIFTPTPSSMLLLYKQYASLTSTPHRMQGVLPL